MAKTLGFREVRPAHCNALLNSYATALGELNYWSRDPETKQLAEDASKRVDLLTGSVLTGRPRVVQ